MQSKSISSCRLCGNKKLRHVFDLGALALTGFFSRYSAEHVPAAPLEVVMCDASQPNHCGLVQLKHTFDPNILYSPRYGYRSGLNPVIVNHLQETYQYLRQKINLSTSDVVIDIGCNDGTLLNFFKDDCSAIGVDPLANEFLSSYGKHIKVIPQFFSADEILSLLKQEKAKIITSISMFYDVADPLTFAKTVANCLDKDGLWLLEQSYLPNMVDRTAFDTICHEHLGYYALRQIIWLANQVGLKIIDVGTNNINGGSFFVALAHENSTHQVNNRRIKEFLDDEEKWWQQSEHAFNAMNETIAMRKKETKELLHSLKDQKKTVIGFGASTKGNVLLQYYGLDANDIDAIVEINQDKFGCFTPGSNIPIISQEMLRELKPDYVFVLPWHFREYILKRRDELFDSHSQLIFPLPHVEVC